jgi:hypothetical protein
VVDRHNGRVDRAREQGTQIGSTNNGSAGNGASRLQENQVGPQASSTSTPSQPAAAEPSPTPTEPAPSQPVAEAPTTPSDTTSPPPADNDPSFSLDTSSFDNFLQRSSQPSGQPTFSRQPIFQSSTPTTTSEPASSFGSTFSPQFDLSGSLFRNQ